DHVAGHLRRFDDVGALHFRLERGGVDAAVVRAFEQGLDAVVVQARHDDRRTRVFGCCHGGLQAGADGAPSASPADQVLMVSKLAPKPACGKRAHMRKTPASGGSLQPGARERTRTSTELPPLAPEASASTNSATRAGAGR